MASHTLDPAAYSALGVLWSLLFAVGNGLMQPLEQEVARAVSHRRALGIGTGPVLRRAAVLGAAAWLVVSAAVAVAGGTFVEGSLQGESGLVVAFTVGLAGFGVAHLARGTLSANRRFGRYARFFAVEGIGRAVLAGVLAALGIASAGAFGFVLALSPFLGAAAALWGQRGLVDDGPPAPWAELTTHLGWLLAGTVALALIVNGGTLAVGLLSDPGQEAAAGVFLNGLQIARIPLFLFQAVLASLLPKLSRLAGTGQWDELRRALERLVGAILVVGAVCTVGAALVGPPVIDVVFGTTDTLGARELALLAGSFVVIMAAICCDQALIALGGHARMALGWLVALAAFVGATWAGGQDLYLRVGLGLAASAVVAFAWMLGNLAWVFHRHEPPTEPTDFADALAEIPIEP